MGTRHLTCVVLNNQIRVAQYGQWDGYPSGQGVTVYDFLKSFNLRKMKQRVGSLKELTPEQVKEKWKECGAADSEWVTMEVSKAMAERNPHLSRDCGADILQLVLDGKAKEVKLSTNFAADSLFCEWAYVIDLDKKVLEIYKGFITKPHNKGRFANLPLQQEHRGESKYYPIELILEIPFKKLPESEDEYLKMIDACLAGANPALYPWQSDRLVT